LSKPLSKNQQLILDFLKDEIRTKGYPPSIREICEYANLRSTSTVHAHLQTLEDRGHIRRSPSKNRSIEIMDDSFYSGLRSAVNIPIVGKVTAGIPITAIENVEDYFPMPTNIVNNYDCFMLRVVGDSMIEAGILHNDLVLVKRQPDANNGDIVVALIDDSATVKTFYRESTYIRLQPESPLFDPIISDEVVVLGKVIGLFRSM